MIRPPLFGQDSSPQYTAPRLAAIGTSGFTLIFILLVIFVPAPKPKQKFETVRIVLDSTPIEKISMESGEPSASSSEETASTVIENSVLESAPVESPIPETPAPIIETPKAIIPAEPKPVQKTEPKPESIPKPKVEEPVYTKRPEVQLKKSVEDLMNEMVEDRPDFVESEPDWDSMFTDSSNNQTSIQKPVAQRIENALSGSSGSSAKKTDTNISRQSIAETKLNDDSFETDSKTTSKLKDIASTAFQERTYKGNNSSMKMKTGSSSDGTSISMNDGTSRTLVKPKEPRIQISPDAANSLNQTTTVTIKFTVLADGTVPESSVAFFPSSLLTNDLKADIAFQLSTWHFQPGETNASASFDFTIEKR